MLYKVLAFDLFGTVFNPADVPHEERRAYVKHIRTPPWAPLNLPETWAVMPTFADSVPGLNALRDLGYKLAAASNWPAELVQKASTNAGIVWDYVVALEKHQVYKPSLVAYATICEQTGCDPKEVLMVTGNKGAGDDTLPAKIGMDSKLIRGDAPILNILALAQYLQELESGASGDQGGYGAAMSAGVVTIENLNSLSDVLALNLAGLAAVHRKEALVKLKETNEALHSLVVSKLKAQAPKG